MANTYTVKVSFVVTVEGDSEELALDHVSKLVDDGVIFDLIEGNDPELEVENAR